MSKRAVTIQQPKYYPQAGFCPDCKSRLDGASGIRNGRPSESENAELKPGCLTLCAYCGAFLAVTEDMEFRKATTEEFELLRREMPFMVELSKQFANGMFRKKE